jgi:hypothetical protein
MDNSQNTNEEKLIEAPAEEPLLEAPEEEKLIPAHTGTTNKKGIAVKLILGIIGAITLFIIAYAGYIFVSNSSSVAENPMPLPVSPTVTETIVPPALNENDGMTACTMDAKICPDGSSVGRTGPNCEFAPCPGE